MLNEKVYQTYAGILKKELVPAMGCTEPIAIAYAAAKGREVLEEEPEKIEVFCSGNMIKNVKGVVVPNSGGLRGVEIAAILGALGGDFSRGLEVLESVTDETRANAKELMQGDYCTCHLVEDMPNLYIRVELYSKTHRALVEIIDYHTNITKIEKDKQILFEQKFASEETSKNGLDKSLLNIKDILEFANTVKIDDVRDVLERQIKMNLAISAEGLQNSYGAQVGKTLLESFGNGVNIRAAAAAAAGSDARMGGCSLPVVINSGSGNQGLTASLPVIEYAAELHSSKEQLYRALVLSNLVAIHQKYFIGSLSAFCGAVSAASGSGAAITYLSGGSLPEISRTIVNTIANVGGIVCDGAKSSCAAKIASAVSAAVMAHHMSCDNRTFQPGEGLVRNNVEKTIQSIGHVGRVGMKQTDLDILNLMIRKD